MLHVNEVALHRKEKHKKRVWLLLIG